MLFWVMIQKVSHNLYVGDINACKRINNSDCIIHSCKFPCYTRIAGKKIDKSDPNYLYFEAEKDLYLNIIDSDEPLFFKLTFDVALEFIKKHIFENKVIIHCNEGRSRSPQIAMLYLFHNLDYREAQNRMLDIYEWYNPSIGIDEWLGYNWYLFKK